MMKNIIRNGIIIFTVFVLALSMVSASNYDGSDSVREKVYQHNSDTYKNYHPPSRNYGYRTAYKQGFNDGYHYGYHDGASKNTKYFYSKYHYNNYKKYNAYYDGSYRRYTHNYYVKHSRSYDGYCRYHCY